MIILSTNPYSLPGSYYIWTGPGVWHCPFACVLHCSDSVFLRTTCIPTLEQLAHLKHLSLSRCYQIYAAALGYVHLFACSLYFGGQSALYRCVFHLVCVVDRLTTSVFSFQGHRWKVHIAEAVGRVRTRARRTRVLEDVRDEARGRQHQGHLHNCPADPGADGRALDVGQAVSAAVPLLAGTLDVQSIMLRVTQ